MKNKELIRKTLRQKRQHLDSQSVQHAATQVASQVLKLPEFITSNSVAYYLAQEGELDPSPIIQQASKLEKQLFLPILHPEKFKQLAFYSYSLHQPLVKNRYGILEPNTDSLKDTPIPSIDIMLLPLVGFDEACNRLGRGAGYYDRSLAFIHEQPGSKKPVLIGLAYEFQKLPQLTPASWDIPLDMVVTESAVYRERNTPNKTNASQTSIQNQTSTDQAGSKKS